MQNKLLFYGMILVLVGLVVAQLGLNMKSGPAPLDATDEKQAPITTDDPVMQTAFEKARERLDYFFKVVEQQPPGTQGYSLKVGVRENDQVEYFWVYPFERTADGFKGRINDAPEKLEDVFKGQMLRFNRGQIVDWTFDDTETDTMHGNFTGCVELQRQTPDHAEQLMELYGLRCEKMPVPQSAADPAPQNN